MILELGSNLYHLLIFLIVAWTIMRFLIAITKIPTVPREKRTKGKEENVEFTK
jgi:large-conductance mechanosensitive channel